MSPGVIWVAALLSTMLSLDRLFQHDYEDGSLELMLLSPVPLEVVVLSKVVAHWLLTGLPLVVVSPLLAVFLNMPNNGLGVLTLSLLLGTPIASLIGAVGGALTLGARRGGVLISLLVLPLYIPLLIFGVAAVDAGIGELPVRPHLLILAAMLAAALPMATWASTAALRQSCE